MLDTDPDSDPIYTQIDAHREAGVQALEADDYRRGAAHLAVAAGLFDSIPARMGFGSRRQQHHEFAERDRAEAREGLKSLEADLALEELAFHELILSSSYIDISQKTQIEFAATSSETTDDCIQTPAEGAYWEEVEGSGQFEAPPRISFDDIGGQEQAINRIRGSVIQLLEQSQLLTNAAQQC